MSPSSSSVDNAAAAVMGQQSQHRVPQAGRSRKLPHRKQRKQVQMKISGKGAAFDSAIDCEVCRRGVHRAHHPRCILARKRPGAAAAAANRHQSAPETAVAEAVRRSVRTSTAIDYKQFAAHGQKAAPMVQTVLTAAESQPQPPRNLAKELCQVVKSTMMTRNFRKDASKSVPLPIHAVVQYIVKTLAPPHESLQGNPFFHGATLTVPPYHGTAPNPHYHSIEGTKILLVDWERLVPGLKVPCPSCGCRAMKSGRTNYSHNGTAFPIFNLEGPPSWAVVQVYDCLKCGDRVHANEGRLLCILPEHVSSLYPVEPRFASKVVDDEEEEGADDGKDGEARHRSTYHLSKTTTNVFDSLMLSYASGDKCSTMLYSAINQHYVSRVACYYSECYVNQHIAPIPYPEKDGEFMTKFPPLGDSIRDLYENAWQTNNNHWGISEKQRFIREIQAVICKWIIAQDHTFAIVRNYQKRLGAKALWDVCTETGEIACAVLVESTKTKEFARRHSNLRAVEVLDRQQCTQTPGRTWTGFGKTFSLR